MDAEVHTNMFLESFHRLLKRDAKFLNSTQNNRLDLLIGVLLKFDKYTQRQQVLSNYNRTPNYRINMMNAHHKKALLLDTNRIRCVAEGKWEYETANKYVHDIIM